MLYILSVGSLPNQSIAHYDLISPNLQMITAYASQTAQLPGFLHSALVAGPGSVVPNCCIAVLHGDITDDETWALQLEHSASTIVDVESLRTGWSAEVGGRVKVLRRRLSELIDGKSIEIESSHPELGLDEQYFALSIDGIPRFYKR